MKNQKSCFAILISLTCCLYSSAAIRYVSQSGAGIADGSSWSNALPSGMLQNAINASNPGDEVWVSCGTYLTSAIGDRTASFRMRNGVTVYGSFQGTETVLSQRVFSCGPCSILSGEIGVAGITDNAYHVVSNLNLNNSAVLDGFVVSGGNDNRAASGSDGLGGGIYNNGSFGGSNSSPTIRNCLITNNRAVFGGGIFNNGSFGGNANPVISHCIISGNTAIDGGGGIDNFGLGGNASPTIVNCIIESNTALVAGGMYCWGGNPGGNSNPTILNSVFANNSAIAGNAGGLIADNSNSSGGFNDGSSNVVIRNSIFRNNTATGAGPQFAIKGSGTVSATYSAMDLAGQIAPHILSGATTGNISGDPLFVNIIDGNGTDNCWMTADDGLNILNTSPAVDAGNNTGVPVTDIRFFSRIQNAVVDIGAYETPGNALAMRLTDIHGKSENRTNLIFWNTVDEENGVSYFPERSADARKFETLGIVSSVRDIHGNGRYIFRDPHPLPGNSYYRVRYIERPANIVRYSKIASIGNPDNQKFRIVVDPKARKIKFPEANENFLGIELLNSNGLVVSRARNEKELSYPQISTGIYVVRVMTANGNKNYRVFLGE